MAIGDGCLAKRMINVRFDDTANMGTWRSSPSWRGGAGGSGGVAIAIAALFVRVEHLHATISTGCDWRHLRQACVHFIQALVLVSWELFPWSGDDSGHECHIPGGTHGATRKCKF